MNLYVGGRTAYHDYDVIEFLTITKALPFVKSDLDKIIMWSTTD